MNNPYWDNITEIAEHQRKKGVAEYGQGLEYNAADAVTRIAYLEEELVDGLMYCEWIKDKLQENSPKNNKKFDFPGRLRRLRKDAGLSQREVAERTGISEHMISAYEAGRNDPTLIMLYSLADYFGITLDELCKGGDNEQTTI